MIDGSSTTAPLQQQLAACHQQIIYLTALLAEQDNFQILFNSIQDFVFVLKANGDIIYTNRAAQQSLGYTPGQLQQMNMRQVYPADQRARVAAMLAGRDTRQSLPLQTKDGRLIAVETTVIQGQWNGQEALFGLCRDVSQHKKMQNRLEQINKCFLQFGANPLENIRRLTALAGELLGATCALYNRLQGDELITTAGWQTPPDYVPRDTATGHICFDVITQGSTEVVLVPDLLHSTYAQTDPNVRCYNLQTYLGRAVRRGQQPVGSLCVVYTQNFAPTEDDTNLLGLLASAISVEEDRWQAQEKLENYHAQLQQQVAERTAELSAANSKLRQQEKDYRTVFNAAPVSISVVQDGKYVFANPTALHLLGYSRAEDFIGMPALQTISPRSQQLIKERINRIDQNQPNPPLEIEIVRPDGTLVLVESTSIPIEFEGRLAALTYGRDLTQQRQAEELLHKHASVVEQTADSVIITDKEGVIEYVNPAFEALTGYSLAEATGQTPRLLKSDQHPVEFYQDMWAQILAGKTFRAVLINKKKNGQLFYEEKTITPLKNHADQLTHFVSTGKDITSRTLAEQERHEREQFLAILNDIIRVALDAPDLQTMFNVLAIRLQLLFEADSCFMIRWDDPRQLPALTAAAGVTPQELQRQQLALNQLAPQPSLTGHALKIGQTVAINDVLDCPFASGLLAANSGIKSALAIPLIAGSQQIGAAVVAFKTGQQFSDAQIAQANQLARPTALALAKALLLEETRARWREAETLRQVALAVTESLSLDERIELILEYLSQLITFDSASVQLLHKDYLEVVSGRGFPNLKEIIGLRFSITGDNINARIAREKQAIVLHDVWDGHRHFFDPPHDQIRSWLGVPLLVRDRLIGMLTVDNMQPGHFTQEHLRLVMPFANQVAVAIENSQLYEQARRDADIKAVLLREVNHRVKNNLSAIIGLLYAERRHLGVKDDVVYQNIMQDLINRVKGLSVVHNMLSASEWAPLPLAKITQKLINTALHSLPSDGHVTVEVTPAVVQVTAKQANNLALIINELATNTIKYALNEQNSACIKVEISPTPARVRLKYRDNGPGFPQAVLEKQQQNVGLYLVETLVRDGLLGRLSMYNDHGAVIVIEF